MKSLFLPLLASLILLTACAHQKQKVQAEATNTVAPTAADDATTAAASDAKVKNSVAVPEVLFTADVLNDLRARPDGQYFPSGLLRSISAQVRASLIEDGITVFEAKDDLTTATDSTYASNQLTDVLTRIERGDFGQAQYVLSGVASHVLLESHTEPIPGTVTNMDGYQLTIAVDYSMIDTTTREVISSFQAIGKGMDNHLTDKDTSPYNPKRSDLILAAQRNLAADVARNLAAQGIITTPTTPSTTLPASAPGSKTLGPDLKSLKIYRK